MAELFSFPRRRFRDPQEARGAPGPAPDREPANGDGVGREWGEEALRLLARLTGAPVRPYATYDFGRQRDEGCLSVILTEGEARPLLAELRERLPAGTVAFIGTTRWLGDECHAGAELVVGPGESQFDILRLARTDGVNHDLTTEDIIAKLREYDAAHGITIVRAETDTVEFNLDRNPADIAAFAADLYAFCPDIVDQGLGSVSALAESIEVVGAVSLWWD